MAQPPRSGTERDEQPAWQPVAAVGMLTSVVQEQLDHTRAQLALMDQARPCRPDARILDDHTVSETLRVCTGRWPTTTETCSPSRAGGGRPRPL